MADYVYEEYPKMMYYSPGTMDVIWGIPTDFVVVNNMEEEQEYLDLGWTPRLADYLPKTELASSQSKQSKTVRSKE